MERCLIDECYIFCKNRFVLYMLYLFVTLRQVNFPGKNNKDINIYLFYINLKLYMAYEKLKELIRDILADKIFLYFTNINITIH